MLKKKSLGQHFLYDRTYLELIATTVGLQKGERVLEVGPGEGTLTQVLLAHSAQVIAIEKDHRLISVLREKFAGKDFEVIEGDVLELAEDRPLSKDGPREYKIVANIPYYITGAFLKKFLTAQNQPSAMTLLVQKEVALRIAREKKESILSLSVKAYGEPQYIKTVPAGAFSPPPLVDSAILQISDISRKNFTTLAQEERFFALVRAGFAKKRKLLKRNLESVLGPQAVEALKNAEIAENARAEDVPLQKWLVLSKT